LSGGVHYWLKRRSIRERTTCDNIIIIIIIISRVPLYIDVFA
jgi:hypothetical protein